VTEIQRQIVRGEEVYYEETQAYGSNLFRGWETFIDSRDVLGTSSNTTTGVQGGGPRRVPNDFRWFSSSATSLASRHLKPEPMGSCPVSSTVTSASPSELSTAPASSKSATTSTRVSTKSDTAGVPKKDPKSISEPPAPSPSTKQEPSPKVVAEPASANVDSNKAEPVESSKEASHEEAMDEDDEPEPALSTAVGTDESKREKRKTPSESADSATKEGKDAAPRRTKRKRRSGAN
jgi:hypothetical protein